MPATYEPIATTTLGSAAASITFSSIPATYTDLRVVLTAKGVSGSDGQDVLFRYNSDSTATNYSWTQVYGNGTSAASNRQNNNRLSGQAYISDTIPELYTMDIFSYAGSTYKTALFTSSTDRNGSGVVSRVVSLWQSTSAINNIYLYLSGSYNLDAGTTATLYGIKNA